MKYIAIVVATLLVTPAMADKFEEVVPENVCWYGDVAYGLGSHNPNISTQFRGAAPAAHNTGYGLFCVMKSGYPTWVYMDYDHTQERWVSSNIPFNIE